jgi:hypothetical protein
MPIEEAIAAAREESAARVVAKMRVEEVPSAAEDEVDAAGPVE